jgi:hypothetical protein
MEEICRLQDSGQGIFACAETTKKRLPRACTSARALPTSLNDDEPEVEEVGQRRT